MESKTYTYSMNAALATVLFLLLFIAIFTSAIFPIDSDQLLTIVPFTFIDIVAIVLLVIRIKKIRLAYIETIAMSLDTDKLEYYEENKIVYWKDIRSVGKYKTKHGFILKFILINKNEVLIPLHWLSGDNEIIYNEVNEYYQSVAKTALASNLQ